MSPQIKARRETVIRHCALRLRYRRAWASGRVNICDLAALLARMENAGEQRRLLASELEDEAT